MHTYCARVWFHGMPSSSLLCSFYGQSSLLLQSVCRRICGQGMSGSNRAGLLIARSCRSSKAWLCASLFV